MTDEYLPHDHEDENTELFHEEEIEAELTGERPASQRSAAAEDIPQPVYRLKMIHSSETFHAYYVPPSPIPRFMSQCALEAALEGPRQDHASAGIADNEEQSFAPCEWSAGQLASPAMDSASDEFIIPPRSLVIAPTKYGRDLVVVLGV
ncbi:MAG: hypothetical protein N3A02_05375, partial [Rectinema sp.]|nr:hypothetical protein [Rectinema sp.]